MSSIKRYDICKFQEADGTLSGGEMRQSDRGPYVLYTDHLSALAQARGSGDGVREAVLKAVELTSDYVRSEGSLARLGPTTMQALADRVLEQVAALTSPPTAEVRGGWRSMESAPKDGTVVIVGYPGRNGYVRLARYEEILRPAEGYSQEWRSVSWPVAKTLTPTHWIPLPAAPSAERTGE